MQRFRFAKILISICIGLFVATGVSAQPDDVTWVKTDDTNSVKSQEISDKEGIPVLIKHLPDWENAKNRAVYILSQEELRSAAGNQPVFDAFDFVAGTEAVFAPYPQGKLLIIEFQTPQASTDADTQIQQKLAENVQTSPTVYRRIGNYNAFVFEAQDEASANALLDQIKYEKTVYWQAGTPNLLRRAERAFIETTFDIFFSTVMAIVLGLAVSIVAGIVVGIAFYYFREHKRANMSAFSDAGGMTRLNLDGLTPDIAPDRLLKQ